MGDRDELLASLRPGSDGLVLRAGSRRATLLPSVWPNVRDADEFVAILWAKAGLRPRHWGPDVELSRYETAEFGDPGPRPPIR